MNNEEIRVRIAPSPTGSPHVGTAYIALFNYCFAKSHGGKFVLRIEDTDQERSDPVYEAMIMEALKWTGISWDEGPDVGGEFGPYRQSERTAIYRAHAQELMDAGHAYRCFCTPETLITIRGERSKHNLSTGYDGRCSRLEETISKQRAEAGELHTIRMNVPADGTCHVDDPMRDDVQFDYRVIDHQVLLKSNGFPTYHLANVVDDHLMKITHVIRGEDWLSSQPKHNLLYQYFGWQPPIVYHLPLLRNADKSKLSKRKNPTSILYYRELGIIPEALLNFLGLMAYSMPEGQEVFTVGEMVQHFDISRMSLGGPVFDLQKLTWINQQHLASMSDDELVRRVVNWRMNPAFFAKLMPLVNKRMHRLGDFIQLCDFMFFSNVDYELESLIPKKKEQNDTRDTLQLFVRELESLIRFEESHIESAFKRIGDMQGWSLRDLTASVRIAITGKKVAPPLFGVMEILGSDLCRNRLMEAIKKLGGKKSTGTK